MNPFENQVTRLCSAIALISLAQAPVYAQERTALTLEEVTITASRLKTSGYEAPTPITMLGSEDMDARGVTNIADLINEVPSFTGSLTGNSTVLNSRQNGVNGLNLRGLGANRNLVLVNGRRHVPFDENGIVDVNAIPTVMIKRVEIVTGGASAAWGSDAVSGVVNIIYDDELEGAKFDVQGGESGEGDATNGRISGAFGQKFANGRGHFVVAGELFDNDGVPRSSARDWSNEHWAILRNPANTSPTDGIPTFIIRPNAALFLASPNGVTLPGASAVSNLEFFPDGTAGQRELGIYAGGSHMEGGSGSYMSDNTALDIPVERQALLSSIRYDLSDTLRAFGEASYTVSETDGPLIDAFRFGSPTIKSGNPYLPASVQQAMDENDIASFNLYRTYEDFPPIASVSKNENTRVVLGLEGDFGASGWWEAYYEYGEAEFNNRQPFNLLSANLVLAADAVRDPATGEIVCAANVGGANGAPGCAPANLFGKGSISAEAIDFITDTGGSLTKLDQNVFSVSAGGEFFEGWAGPIVGAFGAEYRKETLDRTVSENDDNFAFIIVNAQPLNGEMDVTEAFTEWGVPLISGNQSLDFNAAVRWADYSSVGSTVSWKTGLVYEPIESLVIRGTISKDIRAPSIGEQFLEATLLFANVQNPFTGNTDSIQRLLTGNQDLDQEEGDTKTVGVVWSPANTAFQISVDWYDITVTDAIGRATEQQLIDRCFAGEQDICNLIDFDQDQTITNITNPLLNLGSLDVEGVDVAGDYNMPLGAGTLGIKFLASYLINKDVDASGTNPVDAVGEMSGRSGSFGAPETKARLGLSYDSGPWGIYGQARFISSGKYDPNFTEEDLSAADNSVPSVTYFDISGYYRFDVGSLDKFELYGGVTNLGDKDPPIIPRDFISNTATNPFHYDVIGRRYYAGVRMNF